MPGSLDDCPGEAEETASSVLQHFVSIPEQTYEEFLSVFTGLPREGRGCQGEDDHSPQGQRATSAEMQIAQRAQELDGPEQLAIGDGVTVGRCHSLPYSRRVQVDNYFSASDIGTDSDKQAPDPSLMLYPGEADTATAVTKPIIRSTCLETHAASTPETATDEHLGDDTQPFSLDQSFDYDHVALTPKFSEAEMKFLDARGRREVGEKES
ncbi:intraflagellar transport-associated protein isoform X1 [Pseudophryne corroboree]|uniref:intraflagellar transport-associated protein isoform X1 n=1 Tax=Pseudophryne corroboree TaxID=495146 RepID=UPI00308182C5